MNLVKYIASCGIASRRQSETLIRSGAVKVNKVTEHNPARQVEPEDIVTVNGELCQAPEQYFYILLNKPRGFVCSNADRFAGGQLAVNLIALPGVKLVSAGRLDKDSEGAIIFSNDGNFINMLAHPRYGIIKTYIVETAKELKPDFMQQMKQGVRDGGEMLRVKDITPIGTKRYRILLNEGKKREIRRLTAKGNAPTVRLTRVAIGDVTLGKLPLGKWRELSKAEVESFLARA